MNCKNCHAVIAHPKPGQEYCQDPECVRERNRAQQRKHHAARPYGTTVCPFCKETFTKVRLKQRICPKKECQTADNLLRNKELRERRAREKRIKLDMQLSQKMTGDLVEARIKTCACGRRYYGDGNECPTCLGKSSIIRTVLHGVAKRIG